MSTINDGGPAFPMQEPQAIHAYAIAAVDGITDSEERDRAYDAARAEAVGGATLRDYFAAKAMQGWSANRIPQDATIQDVAAWAYRQADAMLETRSK